MIKKILQGALVLSSLALAGVVNAEGEEKKAEPATEQKGPPFGEAPKKADDTPRPPDRSWTVKAGEFEIRVQMKPGVPDPDQLTEILVFANAIPKTPHPVYGSRVPLENASLTVTVESPARETVGRFVAHQMPQSTGRYGLHFTPKQEGIYSLAIRGTSADGKAVSADVKLPVKVWPLPAELQGAGDVDKGAGGRRPLKQ
ncbi:hypothetical protein L6R52_16630 [Myxococcota bacterium]|nr:hypothetical protein [Myxococcota bacterium]